MKITQNIKHFSAKLLPVMVSFLTVPFVFTNAVSAASYTASISEGEDIEITVNDWLNG